MVIEFQLFVNNVAESWKQTELVVLPPLKSPSLSNLDFSATAHQKKELALPSLVSDSSASTEIAIDVSSQHSFFAKNKCRL